MGVSMGVFPLRKKQCHPSQEKGLSYSGVCVCVCVCVCVWCVCVCVCVCVC